MAFRQRFSISDLELINQLAIKEARDNFWAYRQYINPKLKIGWFPRELARILQRFNLEWKLGKRPIIGIATPPQHGKSTAVNDFISWASGNDNSIKTIYSSFSDRLGVRANMHLQRVYTGDKYRQAFPNTRINDRNTVTLAGRYLRNREILEYVDAEGYFRNTTVGGPITGETLDLGIIDDAIKGRVEANSKTTRDKTWDWYTDDFYSRLSEHAAVLWIATRWHLDDPMGRLIENVEGIKIHSFPAIAEEDEEYRKKGDALFPEHKSLDFLLARKSVMSESGWQSVYQQNPIIKGGSLFPIERFVLETNKINKREIEASIRYWDKAATQDGGAFTAGVLMHKMRDGSFFVTDVCRGQWSASNREEKIKMCAQLDNTLYSTTIWVEQEPGSGGKESAQNTVKMLAGFRAYADPVTGDKGDKTTRAESYAAQVQNGNVHIVIADWAQQFVDEHETFPAGKYKDQVDAAAGAFNKLVGKQRAGLF